MFFVPLMERKMCKNDEICKKIKIDKKANLRYNVKNEVEVTEVVTSNTIFFNNLEFWRKNTTKKMGELEEKLGVSKGYFARLGKESGNFPSIDVLSRLADQMGITIDSLLGVEMSTLGSRSSLLHDFIKKLKNDTANGVLKWEEDNYVINLDEDVVLVGDDDPNSPYEAYMSANPVHACYEQGKTVYLYAIRLKSKEEKEKKKKKMYGYQLSLFQNDDSKTERTMICRTDMVLEVIAKEINELAIMIQREISDIDLSGDAVKCMQDILKM